jgi:hypothetical protein
MSECQEWTGYVNAVGYGQMGRNTLAHRWIYEQNVGPIPEGMVVHHTCENRLCVNPDHLQLVSRGDHVRIHRAVTECPKCGSSRRRQNYLKGRPNGHRCMDCHNRRQRERLAAKKGR